MSEPDGGVLLDTHTLIWTVSGVRMTSAAQDAIALSAAAGSLRISVVTAWELGLLFRQERLGRYNPQGLDARSWFHEAVSGVRASVDLVDPDAAFEAIGLPDLQHRDPADRLLIATARKRNLTLVTRDRPILDYAALGHVRAIAC